MDQSAVHRLRLVFLFREAAVRTEGQVEALAMCPEHPMAQIPPAKDRAQQRESLAKRMAHCTQAAVVLPAEMVAVTVK